jgi:protein-arginine kinase activator protein McsA
LFLFICHTNTIFSPRRHSFLSRASKLFPAAEDLSNIKITKIAGLTWEQWNERLAMPLVTTLREGPHPLVFPRDLCVSTMKTESSRRSPSSEMSNSGAGASNANSNSSSNAAGNGAAGNGEGGFACPDCGRMYKLKSSLRNHQKWECGKEPQFQCPYCVYRAKQKMHIGRHMERMHKEKFFKIEGDGKIIALEEALNQIVQAGCNEFNATI